MWFFCETTTQASFALLYTYYENAPGDPGSVGKPVRARVHLTLQVPLPLPAWATRERSRDVAQPGSAHPWGG